MERVKIAGQVRDIQFVHMHDAADWLGRSLAREAVKVAYVQKEALGLQDFVNLGRKAMGGAKKVVGKVRPAKAPAPSGLFGPLPKQAPAAEGLFGGAVKAAPKSTPRIPPPASMGREGNVIQQAIARPATPTPAKAAPVAKAPAPSAKDTFSARGTVQSPPATQRSGSPYRQPAQVQQAPQPLPRFGGPTHAPTNAIVGGTQAPVVPPKPPVGKVAPPPRAKAAPAPAEAPAPAPAEKTRGVVGRAWDKVKYPLYGAGALGALGAYGVASTASQLANTGLQAMAGHPGQYPMDYGPQLPAAPNQYGYVTAPGMM